MWGVIFSRKPARLGNFFPQGNRSLRGKRRVVFFLNHPVVLDHFFPIFQNLDPQSFSVMFKENSPGFPADYRATLISKLDADVEIVGFNEAVRARKTWRVCLSIISPRPFDFGLTRVKLEHGIYDYRGDSYGPANQRFDTVLCHGPYSARRLKKSWGVGTSQIGYPKYSKISEKLNHKSEFRRALGVRDGQILVTWLPTLDEENSIGRFWEELATLPDNIFLVAQIHPMTALRQPDQVQLMVESGITILDDYAAFVLPDILLGSDVTLHDFGGIGQAAIFLGSNPLFLALPDHLRRANGDLIPEALVRDEMGSVSPGMVSQAIVAAVNNSKTGIQRRQKLDDLRSRFFSRSDGTDALLASEAIQRLANRPIWVALFTQSQIARYCRRLVAGFALHSR